MSMWWTWMALTSRNPLIILCLSLLNLFTLYLITDLSPVSNAGTCSPSVLDDHNGRSPHLDMVRIKEASEERSTIRITTTQMVTTTVVKPSPSLVYKKTIPGPAFCDECSVEDKLCQKYGKHNLAKSRLYEGTNTRFKRVIAKALEGKPVKIAVIGGSVTAGHGVRTVEEKWPLRFVEDWKKLFPKSETVLSNGAVPSTGSNYFSMCFLEHIDADADLVVLELGINDQRYDVFAESYELLLRGLLALPNNPAILHIHAMGLAFPEVSTGADHQSAVSEYYDSPVLSLRNMLASHVYKRSELERYYFDVSRDKVTPDLRHVKSEGHAVMSDLLIAYTQRQLCTMERERADPRPFIDQTGGKLASVKDLGDVPRLRMFGRYDRETVIGPVKPFCMSARTTKHPLVPFETKGWAHWVLEIIPDKTYLRATEAGDYAKFKITVGLVGRVRVSYLRSNTFGLGDIWCWMDDNKNMGRLFQGWWRHEVNIAHTETVADNVPAGEHILTCEIMEKTSDVVNNGHEFRLIAVDAC